MKKITELNNKEQEITPIPNDLDVEEFMKPQYAALKEITLIVNRMKARNEDKRNITGKLSSIKNDIKG